MKPATQVLIERYQKHLYAIAFNICRNQQDAEDVVQDTFIQYHTYKKEFDTEEHIRAWLIRVAINKAKNITRSFWHRNKCNFCIKASKLSSICIPLCQNVHCAKAWNTIFYLLCQKD